MTCSATREGTGQEPAMDDPVPLPLGEQPQASKSAAVMAAVLVPMMAVAPAPCAVLTASRKALPMQTQPQACVADGADARGLPRWLKPP